MSHYIPKNKLEQVERLRSEDIPPPHDYPYYWAILDPKSREDKVKVTYFKNLQTFRILKHTLHTTHLLTLLEKMCKYEMYPMSIVEDKERTRFCPQTDRRTDEQGETSILPFQLRWSEGYTNCNHLYTPLFSVSKMHIQIQKHLSRVIRWLQKLLLQFLHCFFQFSAVLFILYSNHNAKLSKMSS